MEPKHEKAQSSGIIIFAIIALLALAVAWYAFNRSGEDLLPTVAEESQETADDVQDATIEASAEAQANAKKAAADAKLAAAKLEAKTELAAVQARVQAGETYEDVAAEVDDIQADLEEAYDNASVEARQGWAQTKAAFTDLEKSLRDGTGDVLEYFAGLSLQLESDVRVDEEDKIGVSEDDV